MKAQNMKFIMLSLILSFSYVLSLSGTEHEQVHDNSQFPMVTELDVQSVIVFSSVIGGNKILESKLNKKGEWIYGDIPHNQSSSGSDRLTVARDGTGQYPTFVGHGKLPYEMLYTYDKNTILASLKEPKLKYFAHKSVVALKCGKIIIAGIVGGATEKVLTDVDVNIYDPKTKSYGSGLSFGANGKLVSCYEQKENQLYCAYVSQQYPYVSKLMLQHIEVNPTANTMTSKGSQVIKTFYTVFNYLKAVTFNDKEAMILFRVGNNEKYPSYGNSGRDLYYYHMEISNKTEEGLVKGIRYEYLEDDCKFRKDEEDESIDIAVLSQKRIYIACETDEGKFKGYIIYPGNTQIDEFNFNNFDAKDVKNPVFAKFEKSLGIFYTYINENNNYDVYFHLMNYPDCKNYFNNRVILIPRHYSKEIGLNSYVFLNNPYPAKRIPEQIDVVFEEYENMTIVDPKTGKKIEPGKTYNGTELVIKITPDNI